ncbi:hypothetical protein QTO34_004947 [Cnephaeus nilssonii]|uniref:Taperin n=1 Tax=Cnephaeus nilssonii TaxID=3371016 RepID=A0AA40HMI3_CNENI|nr:hypothetical protein QTO34_004947 [Eptesicus nilssonii]
MSSARWGCRAWGGPQSAFPNGRRSREWAWPLREGYRRAAAAVPSARWLWRPLRSMAGLGRPGPGPRAGMPAWKREILERKRAKLAALTGGSAPGTGADAAGPAEPAGERLVLADSLGPLCENPFMRLESERRRGARRGGGAGAGAAGARPVQQLLELYRRVPGVRTIRADNILIIESVPGFPPAAPDPATGLAARIRAAEVLVYEAPPSPGRVSRLLQKFDPPAAPRRRGSPERSRPLPPPPPQQPVLGPAAPRVGERAACLEPERRGPGPGARRSDFLQKTSNNSFTVHPRGLHRGAGARPLPNGPAAPESPAGAANGIAGSGPGPGEYKPKVESGEPPAHPPPSPGTPSATPASPPALPRPSPASATPSQRHRVSSATSANDSFEIRPASKPDMDTIPAGDLQARALASLRVNSRNSFVFIPKRKATGAPLPQGRQPGRLPEGEAVWASQRPQRGAQLASGADGAPAQERGPWRAQEGACPRPATALVDQAVRWQRPPSPPPSLPAAAEAEPSQGFGVSGLAKNGGEPGRPGLPVTFIDEVDSEDEVPQEAKLPCSGASVPPQYHPSERLYQGGHTFTVVPKRKPGVLPANGEPGPLEAEEVEGDRLPELPAGLGAALKKRYPTVHEIEVIGGYLALQKSCLTKAGSSRKKGRRRNLSWLLVSCAREFNISSSSRAASICCGRVAEDSLPPGGPTCPAGPGAFSSDPPGFAPHAARGPGPAVVVPAELVGSTVQVLSKLDGMNRLWREARPTAGASLGAEEMKISFNDKSLHTTFEYPSESSLVQEAQAEAEAEEAEEDEEEEDGSGLNGAVEKPFALFLPRATFVNSVAPDSPRLPDGSSGLSSYTPKHSVAFSKWQEQPPAQAPGEAEPSLKEVMLTPASHNDLSDFRSEPALYF